MQTALTEEQAYDAIIWSADVSDLAALRSYLGTMPRLRWVKIDRLFVDTHGWDVFDVLAERGVQVFDDGKCVEIPSKLEGLARTHCQRAHPTMSNCMAGNVSTGSMSGDAETLDGLKRWADVCLSKNVLPCGVTVLTSKTDEIVAEEFGFPDSDQPALDQVFWYMEKLIAAGFTDAVCSPQEAAEVTKRFGDAIALNTPGVRPAGSAVGDQARIGTPSGTIRSGAKRLVIGRPLTNGSGTPAENLQAIVDELTAVA